MGAPAAVLGIAIALLVLLPESMAAVRAALRNRMQTSLNLALGSAPFAGGSATVLQGAVHLALFAAFLFLAVVP